MTDEEMMDLFDAIDGYHRMFPRSEWPRLIQEGREAGELAIQRKAVAASQARGDAPQEGKG